MEDQFLSEVHLDLKSNLIDASKLTDLAKQKYVTRIPLLMEDFSVKNSSVDSFESLDDSNLFGSSSDKISESAEVPDLDEDGDFKINRNAPEDKSPTMLTYVHCKQTNLLSVGLQIWRASLFLLDFIFSKSGDTVFDKDSHCIELGCGIGVCSSILQMKVKCLIATDKYENILDLCLENMRIQLENNLLKVGKNTEVLFSQSATPCGTKDCRILDWFEISEIFDSMDFPNRDVLISYFKSKSTLSLLDSDNAAKFCWSKRDISNLTKTNKIIAADCIYEKPLTIAFFKTLMTLCIISEEKEIQIFIAVEKRLNFTIEDLDITSPCYNHFIKILKHLEKHNNIINSWKMDGTFKVTQIKSFEQVICYERNNSLELWAVTYIR